MVSSKIINEQGVKQYLLDTWFMREQVEDQLLI